MELSGKIDYITLTTNRQRYLGDILAQPTDLMMASDLVRWLLRDIGVQRPVLEASAPPKGYHWGFKTFTTGIEIGVSTDIVQQGVMIRLSGSALEEIADARMWLLHAFDKGWRSSRVDIAFDVYDSGITTDLIASNYKTINSERLPRKTNWIQSPRGSTFYIGSRQSNKMLRVYDKGRQQGTSLDWMRLELEMKGDMAQKFAVDAVRNPYLFGDQVHMILGGASPDISEALLEAKVGEPTLNVEIPRTRTNRGLWFHTTVIKAFAGLLRDDPESAAEFLNRTHALISDGVTEPASLPNA